MEPIRLQKYLAHAGVASRRAVERMIEEGRIVIGNRIATLGDKVKDTDTIKIDGEFFTPPKRERVILAFHKPQGVTCTMVEDPENRNDKTLAYYDFGPDRVYPIGRLDKESHGLLILTNDGELANELTHPRYEHEKQYIVAVDRTLSEQMLETLGNGTIIIGDKPIGKAQVTKIDEKTFAIILKEGRNRQIRKMCDAVKLTVLDLKRTRIADITLDDLPTGQYRKVDPAIFEKSLKSA